MKFPLKPRYKKVAKAVYEFYINENITSFPINPLKIISKNKWGLITYSELAKENNITVDDVIEACQSIDGYTIWDGVNYTIAYNDTISTLNRIRFTLMHEIGHIYLNHLIDFEETIINRGGLSLAKYKILEREANAFARNALAPPVIVNKIFSSMGIFTTEILMDLFKLSRSAAEIRLDSLKWDRRYNVKYIFFYLSRFKAFVDQVIYSLWCPDCNYSFARRNANYCPICGNQDLIKDISISRGDVLMKYNGIELDETHKAIQCPICENEDIFGDYCQICGTYLVNRCTGFLNEPSNRYQGRWHIEFENSCGEFLSGEARFCHVCGSTSTFYESGLLKDWQEEKEMAASQDPFSDITDDDLPF